MKANTDTLQKQEEEKSFQYRSYGKGELAMLYIPNVQQQSAVDRFNEWIEAAPGLKERLLSTGMNPRSRHYTPASTTDRRGAARTLKISIKYWCQSAVKTK